MSQYYKGRRKTYLYTPGTLYPFRISRSKIDLFLNCPRCFYFDRRLGVAQPPGYPFSLNSAVDKLLKKEFDIHRADETPHPLMKTYGIDAVPLKDKNIKVAYLHSDVDTLERSSILHSLRLGEFDVLVGINLLREGIDLPEVSLIGILDADKEGFLRSKTALVQIIGRAARHINGKVIMYAQNITGSMRDAISETNRRRKYQEKYNIEHKITPRGIEKDVKPKIDETEQRLAEIDRSYAKLPRSEKKQIVSELTLAMNTAARNLEFEKAAELRDEISLLESKISESHRR